MLRVLVVLVRAEETNHPAHLPRSSHPDIVNPRIASRYSREVSKVTTLLCAKPLPMHRVSSI